MKRMSKKPWALSGGICLALMSGSAVSQSFNVHNGPPEEGEGIENYSYISLDGKVTIDPKSIYTDLTTQDPGHAEGMPTDTSLLRLHLRLNYDAPSGDELPFELVLPVDSPKVHRDDFAKGYYRDMSFTFRWDERPLNYRLWTSFARIIVPNVQKIPVYMHADLLNTAFYSGSETYRYFDFIRLRNLFHGDFEKQVGHLATNADGAIRNNYGCSGWFQFRFFGYIDPGWDGASITKDGQLDGLPDGITIVDRITRCGSETDTIVGFPGCAKHNGTKIALEARVFNSGALPPAVVTLHEIGHTKGLDHEEMEEDNLMAIPSGDDNVEIRRDQCPNFSVSKQYVSPEPWQE